MAQFTNQAQLSFGNYITNSNIAVGEIIEVLSATKTAVRDDYEQNGNVAYVVSIVNTGTMPYNGLSLTDNLGAYLYGTETLIPLTYVPDSVLYYNNGVLQPTPTVTVGDQLVISGINVPAGGNATIIYEASVNSFAPLAAGSQITNQAVISGLGVTPINVTETVTVENMPFLTITKAICPVPVTENGILTYTFLIQNTGNTDAVATDNVFITDLFNPILENITVTFNGVSWTEGVNYTYDQVTGLFKTIEGQVTVPAATYTQDPTTGTWIVNPGVSTLVITGTV